VAFEDPEPERPEIRSRPIDRATPTRKTDRRSRGPGPSPEGERSEPVPKTRPPRQRPGLTEPSAQAAAMPRRRTTTGAPAAATPRRPVVTELDLESELDDELDLEPEFDKPELYVEPDGVAPRQPLGEVRESLDREFSEGRAATVSASTSGLFDADPNWEQPPEENSKPSDVSLERHQLQQVIQRASTRSQKREPSIKAKSRPETP